MDALDVHTACVGNVAQKSHPKKALPKVVPPAGPLLRKPVVRQPVPGKPVAAPSTASAPTTTGVPTAPRPPVTGGAVGHQRCTMRGNTAEMRGATTPIVSAWTAPASASGPALDGAEIQAHSVMHIDSAVIMGVVQTESAPQNHELCIRTCFRALSCL